MDESSHDEREARERSRLLAGCHPDVKVIAMSGGTRVNARDFLKIARLMGACQTLEKPFSTQELELAIEAALGP